MLLLPVSVHVYVIEEGFGAPRHFALELGCPMSCSLVVSQVGNLGFPLSTFLTFRSFANAMFHPHVLRKGITVYK